MPLSCSFWFGEGNWKYSQTTLGAPFAAVTRSIFFKRVFLRVDEALVLDKLGVSCANRLSSIIDLLYADFFLRCSRLFDSYFFCWFLISSELSLSKIFSNASFDLFKLLLAYFSWLKRVALCLKWSCDSKISGLFNWLALLPLGSFLPAKAINDGDAFFRFSSILQLGI